MTDRNKTGERGEDLAVHLLEERGMTVLARNWRCAAGELDIIAEEIAPDYASGNMAARWLVLVEVRTRRSARFGTALQAFTQRKQTKLKEVAAHYLQQSGWQGPWRIDAVAIQLDRAGHLVDAEYIPHAVMG